MLQQQEHSIQQISQLLEQVKDRHKAIQEHMHRQHHLPEDNQQHDHVLGISHGCDTNTEDSGWTMPSSVGAETELSPKVSGKRPRTEIQQPSPPQQKKLARKQAGGSGGREEEEAKADTKQQARGSAVVRATLDKLPRTLPGLKASEISLDSQEAKECLTDEIARPFVFWYARTHGEEPGHKQCPRLKQMTIQIETDFGRKLHDEFRSIASGENSVTATAANIRDWIVEAMPEDHDEYRIVASTLSKVIIKTLLRVLETNGVCDNVYSSIAKCLACPEVEFIKQVQKIYISYLANAGSLLSLPHRSEASILGKKADCSAFVNGLFRQPSESVLATILNSLSQLFFSSDRDGKRDILAYTAPNLVHGKFRQKFAEVFDMKGDDLPPLEDSVTALFIETNCEKAALNISLALAKQKTVTDTVPIQKSSHAMIDFLLKHRSSERQSHAKLVLSLLQPLLSMLDVTTIYNDIIKDRIWNTLRDVANTQQQPTRCSSLRTDDTFEACINILREALKSSIHAAKQPKEIVVALKAMVNVCAILHDMLRRNSTASKEDNESTRFHLNFRQQLSCADCIVTCWLAIKQRPAAVALIVASIDEQNNFVPNKIPKLWKPSQSDVRVIGNSYKGIRYALWSVVDWRRNLAGKSLEELPFHLLVSTPTPDKKELMQRVR